MDLKQETKWMDLVGIYIKEGATSLDLEIFKLTAAELKQLIEYLPDSQLKELIISVVTSDQEWEPFFEALRSSKIQKLVLNDCFETKGEYLHLMELVKDTTIANCTVLTEQRDFIRFDLDEINRLISYIVASPLESFDTNFDLFNEYNVVSLFEVLPRTRITDLDVSKYASDEQQWLSLVALTSLCRSLELTRLTDLQVMNMGLNIDSMKLLSPALKNSTLEKLDLSGNEIDDDAVDVLVEGLVHSKINHLDLSDNEINGANILGFHLKDTQIKILRLNQNQLDECGLFLAPFKLSSVVTLDIQACDITSRHFQKLMKSLKFSKVTELNVADNDFKLNCESNNIFKDTNLKRVDVSGNFFDQEALICLGDSIKDSKLNHIDLSSFFQASGGRIELGSFLSEVRISTISSLDLRSNELIEADVEIIALHLQNSNVTQLVLSDNNIGNCIRSLAKLTQLSHLSLSECSINDERMEDLALILKNTQVVQLDLSLNDITSFGAMNLAPNLKDSNLLHLDLSCIKIESDGVESLARGAEDTFITTLSVNNDESQSLFDVVLWRNKIAKQHLLNLFKLISPKLGSKSFCFVRPDDMHTIVFLENWLDLIATVTQKRSAISVLLEDESIQHSKEEIISLMSDEFPSQFVEFLAHNNETDVEAHVSLLKKAEELGLSKIVEIFLIHRPLFTIDKDILHPYFYTLLHKYNHPICNLEIEPEGEQKILRYFTKRREVIEGAVDIIMLLRGKQKQ